MRLPEHPAVKELKHLSISIYEALLACKARAAWIAFGDRETVPSHPRALLGTCVHAVLEKAHGGLPSEEPGARRTAAREMFDRKAAELYNRAHPLLRAKFSTPERMPYYYLFRERAALLALEASARRGAGHHAAAAIVQGPPLRQAPLVENTLHSRDGLLVGRPDYVDPGAAELIDYKTGTGPEDDPTALRDSEARQLRLYVHLAREAGLDVKKGTVVRADGQRVELSVSEDDAAAEGELARDALRSFNAKAAEGFDPLAEPSPESCRYCPCTPFCESFWRQASAAWAERCGTQVEGTVSAVSRAVVQNTSLITLELAARRGTIAPGPAILQQLPERWACEDGTPLPEVGDVVRIVNCRLEDNAEDVALIRPDRLTTAFWTVRRSMAVDHETTQGTDIR